MGFIRPTTRQQRQVGQFRGKEEITLSGLHACESPSSGSIGNIVSTGNTPRHTQTLLTSASPVVVPFPCAYRSLPCMFFTSKAIVPDLYDRPLTLSVLVHQHQAEKTPKGVCEQNQMWLSVIQWLQPPTGTRCNKSHLFLRCSKLWVSLHEVCATACFPFPTMFREQIQRSAFSIRNSAMGANAGLQPMPCFHDPVSKAFCRAHGKM